MLESKVYLHHSDGQADKNLPFSSLWDNNHAHLFSLCHPRLQRDGSSHIPLLWLLLEQYFPPIQSACQVLLLASTRVNSNKKLGIWNDLFILAMKKSLKKLFQH